MSLQIKTKATALEITPEISDFLQNKLSQLEHFLPQSKEVVCDVELEKAIKAQHSGKIYRAEINLMIGGTLFRAEATEETIEYAIDTAKDELKNELRKSGKKRETLLRRGSRRIKNLLQFGS